MKFDFDHARLEWHRKRVSEFTSKFYKRLKLNLGNEGQDFVNFMQDRHLEGGTTTDRLARRSSNLYKAIRREIKADSKNVVMTMGFIGGTSAGAGSPVRDYAPTHEYGRGNIPARMNLRKEFRSAEWRKRFIDAAAKAKSEALNG